MHIHHVCSNTMQGYCTLKQVRKAYSDSRTLPNKRAHYPFHSIKYIYVFLHSICSRPSLFRYKIPWNILHCKKALDITLE